MASNTGWHYTLCQLLVIHTEQLNILQMSVLAFDILKGDQGNVSLSFPAVLNGVY